MFSHLYYLPTSSIMGANISRANVSNMDVAQLADTIKAFGTAAAYQEVAEFIASAGVNGADMLQMTGEAMCQSVEDWLSMMGYKGPPLPGVVAWKLQNAFKQIREPSAPSAPRSAPSALSAPSAPSIRQPKSLICSANSGGIKLKVAVRTPLIISKDNFFK